jgi:hypothetical protein
VSAVYKKGTLTSYSVYILFLASESIYFCEDCAYFNFTLSQFLRMVFHILKCECTLCILYH